MIALLDDSDTSLPHAIKTILVVLCIREDKAGHIEHNHSPVLERLNINSAQWLTLNTEFEQHFSTAVGSENMLQQYKHHTNHQRMRGMGKAKALLHQF